jgi:hypothetical protein
MIEEKICDGVGDPFKKFLKVSLMQQRKDMMEKFSQIP